MQTIYQQQAQVYNSTFLMKVMNYVALALGVTALGAWLAPLILPPAFLLGKGIWFFFILELMFIFTSSFWAQLDKPVNFILFYLFAFLSGFTIYPLLIIAFHVGGTEIIVKALVATIALSFAAGIYAKTTDRNLSGMRGFLMMGIIGLIIVGILQMFWFNSTVELISSAFGVFLFAGFIAYYIQLIQQYPENRPIEAALALYLSVFNLFTTVLRLLIAINRD